MTDKTKKLHISKTEKVWLGVCGGVGEYAEVDPNIVRLVWVAVALFTGVIPGIIIYIIAGLLLPKE
jgi:phage shock protein C